MREREGGTGRDVEGGTGGEGERGGGGGKMLRRRGADEGNEGEERGSKWRWE